MNGKVGGGEAQLLVELYGGTATGVQGVPWSDSTRGGTYKGQDFRSSHHRLRSTPSEEVRNYGCRFDADAHMHRAGEVLRRPGRERRTDNWLDRRRPLLSGRTTWMPFEDAGGTSQVVVGRVYDLQATHWRVRSRDADSAELSRRDGTNGAARCAGALKTGDAASRRTGLWSIMKSRLRRKGDSGGRDARFGSTIVIVRAGWGVLKRRADGEGCTTPGRR